MKQESSKNFCHKFSVSEHKLVTASLLTEVDVVLEEKSTLTLCVCTSQNTVVGHIIQLHFPKKMTY